jgi:hypothetical protein
MSKDRAIQLHEMAQFNRPLSLEGAAAMIADAANVMIGGFMGVGARASEAPVMPPKSRLTGYQ